MYRSLALGAIVVLASASAMAEDPAEGVLRDMDRAITSAKDQKFHYELVTVETGKPDRNLTFEVFLKGTELRRIEFLAPGDVKGMRILVRSPTQSYIYMPAFRKIRRLSNHMKDQGFMGTSFSDHEISLVSYSRIFSGRLLEENVRAWRVEANLRPDVSFPYPRLILDIRKDVKQPVRIQYIDSAGRTAKTETRKDYTCTKQGYCSPKTIKMIDHTRNNLTSRLLRTEWLVDQGLPDSMFSLRSLQRGG